MKRSSVQDSVKFGFSLIEVMIVVVIIGILATLAYPRLERYLISSRQTEAKTNLMAIHTAQKIYHSSNRKYADSLNELGVEVPQGDNAQYGYTLETDGNFFMVTATGNIDSDETKDVWTINQDKKLINVENDVTN
ncbi:MAG: prepilin-type N-terminal cleavage/methylation domain-containing protein [SAR324 cluster bacterium]|nr:prepilin-type N-terminal cleavage/methylation domain-containing protein [SAR324 cluster bacterium]